MNTPFLLIAFKFPPYAGVGGFRWSKLCKYLARLGHEIHVVSVDWKWQGPNTLLEDVQHANLHIYRIPSGYPHNVKYYPLRQPYLNALRNRLLRYTLDRRFFFDDEAQQWGRHLIPFCERLLRQEAIRVVVATGGPFQANRWAAVLKQRNPHLRLIQDFRDEWTDDANRSWPPSQMPLVKSWQKAAVEAADSVVVATEGLLRLFLAGTRQTEGYVIRNGYDPDIGRELGSAIPQDDLSFIHIGNLASGRDRPLDKFLNAVRLVRRQNPAIRVRLVGGHGKDTPRKFSDLLKDGTLELRPHVSQKAALEMVRGFAYALHFNAQEYPWAVSTKIYEYGMLKVPTISFNYGGEIHELILGHDLGYSVHVEKEDLAAFLAGLSQAPKRRFAFDIQPFAYDNLAMRYSELIQA